MKCRILLITFLAVLFIGCSKKSEDSFLVSLDNTMWVYYPPTEIPLNGGSVLSVDEYLVPTLNDRVIFWFYSDGSCDVHVQTATRGQTFHTTRWTCSSSGQVVIYQGKGIWMNGLFLGQQLTINDNMVLKYCGVAKK